MTARLNRLHIVKTLHTVIWAFFAGCIIAIPLFAWNRRVGSAFLLIGVVLVEVVVILANAWRCPLTDVAARYTDDRRDNFDIYLPVWLARYNKQIFGTLFLGGVLLTTAVWLGWLR